MRNKHEKRVPELRFKGFVDDWEQRKLITIVERVTRKNNKLESSLPLTISAKEGLIAQIDFFNKTVASRDISDYYLIKNGEFAYNKSYSNGYPWGAVKRLEQYDIGVLSTLYIVFKAININSNFLAKYYDTNRWYLEVSKYAAEGARNHGLLNISASDFLKTKLVIPNSEEEQAKIAKLFITIDNLIALHKRKLDLLKQIKQGYLQQMFPKNGEKVPKLRFVNFDGNWEERKLGELGKATSGIPIETEFDKIGKYKVINIGSYSEDSKYIDQGVRANNTKKTKSCILNKDDLTMILNDKTSSGNIIGRVLLIDANDLYMYNQRTERIEVYKNKYEPEFLYQLLNSDNIRAKIIRASQGNTQIYVNWSSIRELKYKIPISIVEQKKIGLLLKQLDNVITIHKQKFDDFILLKKSYLYMIFI